MTATRRVRLASLLAQTGRPDEGRRIAEEILDRLRRAPAHVRKLQADWKNLAKDVLRRT